jgi:hypothetical protein
MFQGAPKRASGTPFTPQRRMRLSSPPVGKACSWRAGFEANGDICPVCGSWKRPVLTSGGDLGQIKCGIEHISLSFNGSYLWLAALTGFGIRLAIPHRTLLPRGRA